jgi:hypothetical protein
MFLTIKKDKAQIEQNVTKKPKNIHCGSESGCQEHASPNFTLRW